MKSKFNILLVLIFISASLKIYAQDVNSNPEKKKREKAKSFIELSGGLSVPLGNFAKTDYNDNRSGFASMGPLFSISGVKFLGHSNFGLGGTVSFAYYNLKNMSNMADGYHEAFDVDSTNVHYTRYTSVHVLIGPYYTIPLGIVSIDFKILGGVNFMSSPHIDVLLEDGGNSYTNGGTNYTFWQNSSFASALAANVGVGLRVSPINHFAISLRADYFYSQPVFNITNEYRTANTGRLLTSYTQPFNGINTTLGLVYEFGKKKVK